VLPSVFSHVQNRTGAPYVASLTQTVLALTVVIVFALADADPVLKLFTWLTNLGALGVLLLMAVTSFAVVAYFRKRPDADVTPWAGAIAPAIAGVALLVVLVLGVANFNVLITGATDAPTDTMTIVLPLILFGGGLLGLLVGAWMKANRPDSYARIGEGAGAEGLGSG
jgi:amino acid transporter